MTSFLFWNLDKKRLIGRTTRLVRKHAVDLVILAESVESPEEICSALSEARGMPFHEITDGDVKVRLFSVHHESMFVSLFESESSGVLMKRLRIPDSLEILLVLVHFPSRLNYDEIDQILEATALAQDIATVENDHFLSNTVLVGDLNMNPFDPGVSGAQGLHGVMISDRALKEKRTVNGKSYRFFYNPMWGQFGDRTPGPPGTFHLASSKPLNYFWNIYDQVLLRPSLIDRFTGPFITDHDGVESLVHPSGVPDRSNCSDHLPLLFSINLNKEFRDGRADTQSLVR